MRHAVKHSHFVGSTPAQRAAFVRTAALAADAGERQRA
jgi:hypothetical protein